MGRSEVEAAKARIRARGVALWEHVTFVASDTEPDTEYEIKRRTSDGHYGCGCGSYRFAPKAEKTCKHIDAYLESVGVPSVARRGPRDAAMVAAAAQVAPPVERPVVAIPRRRAEPRPSVVADAVETLVRQFAAYYEQGVRFRTPANHATLRKMIGTAFDRVVVREPVSTDRTAVVVRGERFTFRRGITLGGASKVGE